MAINIKQPFDMHPVKVTRQDFADLIDKILGGWRDYEVARAKLSGPPPEDPFLKTIWKELSDLVWEDPMWWDDVKEQRSLIVDLALLRRENVGSPDLLRCRAQVNGRLGELRYELGTREEVLKMVEDCLAAGV